MNKKWIEKLAKARDEVVKETDKLDIKEHYKLNNAVARLDGYIQSIES